MRQYTTPCVTFLICFTRYPSPASAWSIENALLNWFKSSDAVATLHAKHVESDKVQHMFKDTPLVRAPEKEKIAFAEGAGGQLVSRFMAKEQELLGDWKIGKIVEAAGGDDFDSYDAKKGLLEEVMRTHVTLFSFEDCPWCLLAKRLLAEDYGLRDGDGTLRVIELEERGWEGKRLRAAIALGTGRTSMPACFIGGRSVGGFTDGFGGCSSDNREGRLYGMRVVGATGLMPMHESGDLGKMITCEIIARDSN